MLHFITTLRIKICLDFEASKYSLDAAFLFIVLPLHDKNNYFQKIIFGTIFLVFIFIITYQLGSHYTTLVLINGLDIILIKMYFSDLKDVTYYVNYILIYPVIL